MCICVFVLSLFFNGAIWRVWGLHRDMATIESQILKSREQAQLLDMQISQAKDPSFIERQALDKLDMVGEHDLVFVFSE
ncbi:septum formation initiator family protein [Pseudobdellovibrio exovorus]|nr:septum formation initiator family protein [Pseudobdellovibrio exovorus]